MCALGGSVCLPASPRRPDLPAIVSGEVARRRLRHSVLLFFMTPARLWREMGRRLGRHVDKANNSYGGEGPRGC
eukprot:COSAG01_NODE_3065_length_6646_cov_13.181610_3_plen_74_part_00